MITIDKLIKASQIVRVRPSWNVAVKTQSGPTASVTVRVLSPEVTEQELKSAIDEALALGPVPPNTISMRQCRLQLLALDLLDDIDAAVGSMDRAAQIEWEYANDVTRGFPLVVAMQQLLGMTDEDVDQFFTDAAKL
jgi:hypothetical protein